MPTKFIKHISLFVCSLMIAFSFIQVSVAATDEEIQQQISSKQAELESINKQLESKSVVKEAAQRKANTAYGQLLEVDAELKIEENKVNAIISSINKTQELIESRIAAIEKTQQRLEKWTNQLHRCLIWLKRFFRFCNTS